MARRRRPPAATIIVIHLLVQAFCFPVVTAATLSDDAAALQDLRDAIRGESLGWTGKDPCSWPRVGCDGNRVTSIQVANSAISGTLPPSISKLSKLTTLALQNNQLFGTVPSLSGLTSLQTLFLDNNNFSSITSGGFSGLTNLQIVRLDYNPFSPWPIPTELAQSTSLQSFTASKANAMGTIPDMFGRLPNLQELKLSYNNLTGGLPSSFARSGIQILWLNNQQGEKLSGSISLLGQMPELTQIWLQTNAFSGPIPDLSRCASLFDLQLRDNGLTGVVPPSLTTHSSLLNVSLGNNQLQGPFPSFPTSVKSADIADTNSFCLPEPGPCDPRVGALLAIAADVNYPTAFADAWKGNDPCNRWAFVTCDSQGMITVLNFANQHLMGTISPEIANLTGLKTLLLNNNNLTGTIPAALTMLPNLRTVDVSNNNLTGNVPSFIEKVALNISGNSLLGSNIPSSGSGVPETAGVDSAEDASGASISSAKNGSSSLSARIGVGLGVSVAILLLSGLAYSYYRKTKCSNFEQVKRPHDSSKGTDHVKINIVNGNGYVIADQHSPASSGTASLADPGTMVISIQVLQQVTNNFCESNVIGRGGFGVVYKGELHDGTKIAVKRMESAAAGSKGMNEFLAEIAVLTKVRHRHLVALLGYCIDGNERLLVYEYMPQGTLGQHLFEGPEKGFAFLNWKARITIALDVARGVEYLHSLAQKSFIHRDLKPSNILLDDNMRAKVSDFGLVKLAPEGKCSLETRLAGTFGYLAPEYATTGRVTTKVDVFAFGVVLMEMITGRKALDETQPEESCHLVTWFRRILIGNKGDVGNGIDPAVNVDDEETFKSICTVAELAGHCTAREPNQRPDIGHAVNVLSPLVEQWKPCHRDEECSEGINYDIPLSVALQRWQANEDTSMMTGTFFRDSTLVENTQSSIPLGAACFPDAANCR
ncbi:unnamed protein product [Victoria cruziana]